MLEALISIYIFLLELHIRIKIMSNAEFERMLKDLTEEQRKYALCFRLL